MIVRTFRQNFLRTLENLNLTNLIDLIYYYFFFIFGKIEGSNFAKNERVFMRQKSKFKCLTIPSLNTRFF